MKTVASPSADGHQARHALDLDFMRRRRLASPVGWLVLAAGLAFMATVALDYLDSRDTLAQLLQRQAQLQPPLRPQVASGASGASGARGASAPVLRAAGADLLQVQAQLAWPWDAVLRELESHAEPDLALLSIDMQGQRLRAVGEAPDMDTVVAWLGRLRSSPWILAADLASHEPRKDGAVSVLRFAVDIRWKAPS